MYYVTEVGIKFFQIPRVIIRAVISPINSYQATTTIQNRALRWVARAASILTTAAVYGGLIAATFGLAVGPLSLPLIPFVAPLLKTRIANLVGMVQGVGNTLAGVAKWLNKKLMGKSPAIRAHQDESLSNVQRSTHNHVPANFQVSSAQSQDVPCQSAHHAPPQERANPRFFRGVAPIPPKHESPKKFTM